MKHPDDGALLRHLDGQSLAAEEAEVRQHIQLCVTCTARQQEIRRTLDTVADALQRTDVEPRGSRARNIRWPAAIAAGVLLALTLGVAPVRAWILRLPKTLWEAVVPSEIDNPIAPDTLGVVEPGEVSVSFVPRADVFVVEVTSRQSEGSLTIEIVKHDTATATVAGKGNAEELIVLPSGFQIINAPNSIATYAVQLPARMEQIQVVVAGQPPIVLDLSEGRHEWVIPLARR
jgi:hypothetical protein